MQYVSLILAVFSLASSSTVKIVTFDGNPATTQDFKALNDPVMGGRSTGTWSVDPAGFGIFDGEVKNVPYLFSPGFIKAASDGTFVDAPATLPSGELFRDLVLTVRSKTPEYAGFRVSFASGAKSPAYACSGGGSLPFSRGCFKAKFSVPKGENFTEVRIPLSMFSDKWSPATGDQTTTCDHDSDVCPTSSKLSHIQRVAVWAEGALGKVNLEVKSMALTTSARLLPVIQSFRVSASTQVPCPVVNVQPDFDLEKYISSRWYIQQQMATKYLPASQNYCVYADYKLLQKKSFWGYGIQVHNYAQGSDGTVHDSGNVLCAKVDAVNTNAKLLVGPCFLPRISGFTTGPYWIVAYDEDEGYALVSGGQPTLRAKEGCSTGSGVNGAGLWIFTRQQQRDEAVVQKVRGIAAGKGFDLSVLNDVDQSHCKEA